MFEFGTDGVRGKANEALPVEVGYRLGCFLGNYFKDDQEHKVLVGKDTRLSSGMFEAAVVAGLTSRGVNAYQLGYCPTPAVAHLVVANGFSCGIMISASHNPYYDNGIKVFSNKGEKLDRALEEKIEAYLNSDEELPLATDDSIGNVYDWKEGLDEYCAWLKSLHPLNLSGKKIVIDTANGSACFTAKRVLEDMGAEIVALNHEPNGLNINVKCGSTHPELLQEAVLKEKADIGLAFDGDADRLICVAPDGELVNGDKMIYALGKHLKSKGKLKDDMVVATVMANLGFFKKCEEAGLKTVVTAVGDKYVYEEMVKNGYEVGGEQSGHIIFYSQETTGDGLMTALNILEMILETGKNLNELTDDLFIYPQLLVNVPVQDKKATQENPLVIEACKKVEEALNGEGRILVRPSGTEPLLRVMVEAKTDELCKKYVDEVVEVGKQVNA